MRCAALLLSTALPLLAQSSERRFANGPPTDPSWFPIGVWLQAPERAKRYAELGINLYVGLWRGPTEAQLAALDAAGMRVICEQNDVGLAHAAPTIVAWMHGDEPDNAQGRRLTGYAPPIPPWQVAASYERMRRADPTRPVLLNLGQGAAWDGWHGRGDRTNHPEDYPEYGKGCDIVSFDIYPVTHPHADVRGKLEFTARGVQRLRRWTGGTKPVWAVLETARVGPGEERPTPAQIRAEAWLAICSGAAGIVWFAHEFSPRFVEAGLLQYPEIVAAVADTNAEVRAHAAILNQPPVDGALDVTTEPAAEIALRVHRHDGALHVFAASLSSAPVRATITRRGADKASLVVDLAAHGVHLGRVPDGP